MKQWNDQGQEHCEDALFVLLMEGLGQEQLQAEKERQDRLSGEEKTVTEELDRRCLSMIRKHYGRERARKIGKTLWRTASRVAVVACLMVALFAVAFAASETVRVNTMNLMVKVTEEYMGFTFCGHEEAEDRGPSLSVGWIPSGYTLTEKSLNKINASFEYVDDNENRLIISCTATAGMGVGFDIEDAVVENVTVDGHEGMLIEKDGAYDLAWPDKNNTRLIDIISFGGLSREEVFAIAKALVYD